MAGVDKKTSPVGKGQKTLLSFFQKSPAPIKKQQKPSSESQNGTQHESTIKSENKTKRETELKSDSGSKGDERKPAVFTPTKDDREYSVPSEINDPGLSDRPLMSTPDSSSQPIPSSPIQRRRSGKRKILIIDSDSEGDDAMEDSDDDWQPGAKADDDDAEADAEFLETVENEESTQDEERMEVEAEEVHEEKEPRKQRSPPTGIDASRALSKFSKFSEYEPVEQKPGSRKPLLSSPKKIRVTEDPERYKWLLNIKDADGNSPDDPNYDPRTLFVPNSAWAKFTPFEKQYWEVKQKLWNTVVFFKKGKFYELYENDAEIAHRLFDLKLAGGGRANMSLCGVPEMSFDYWASAFIAKGYKVARVDQAETALGKEMRDIANKKKEEKIIRRELSCVLTGGTLTDATMLVSDLSQYCLALKQDGLDFAACFVDTATSHFYISRFTDKSSDYPLLESLLAQVRPKEIILARGNLERYALKIVRNNTSVDTLWEIVKPDVEFWDAERARSEINAADYFENESDMPEVLSKSLEGSDLSASAIGGLICYLRTLKLDKQLLSLGQFNEYDSTIASHGETMVIDGQTLQNLEVFANTWDGGSEGTLFKLINRCITPFGKRRLRTWITHPLQNPSDIACRADMVDMLMEQDEVASMLSNKLVGLPDAERMLSRVHAGVLRPRDFVKLVGGLESMASLLTWLNDLRTQLPQLEPFIGHTNALSVLEQVIEPWLTAFDHIEAKNNDKLVPQPGIDEEFDGTLKDVTEIETQLKAVMAQYRKDFKSTSLEYRDSGKEIYLIEVPVKFVRQVPRDWQQMGATSKFKRYWSPEVKKLVRSLQEAQELHNLSSQACQQKLYARFCSADNYNVYMEATRIVSVIDCLLSLAKTSQTMVVHCRPEILPTVEDDNAHRSVVEFTQLRHPVATSTDFIPNDVVLGGNADSSFSLLTGANAAGKSTVLRTTCCAILLAQLGCHVPAQSARMTAMDRIMTRLGASDNIFAGKSTFHVELAETERILSEASPRSFVVLDELGRGGSSGDGFAIAEAVLHHLATYVGCLGFFATHYATLYDSFITHPQVKPQKMAIDVDANSREVTFLYKLENGRSEGSFGMNVASMCGVAPHIIEAAEKAAKLYEHTSMLKRTHMSDSTMPLGLQSDIVWTVHHEDVPSRAVHTMLAMASHT